MTQPLPTESKSIIHALHKWRLIGCFWLAQAAFLFFFFPFWGMQANSVNGPEGRPFGEFDLKKFVQPISEPKFWVFVVVALAVLMSLQTILVWPVRKPRPRNQRGWPLRLSIGVAALAGTALAAAIGLALATLLQVLDWNPSGGRETASFLIYLFFCWLVLSYIGGAILMYRFCIRNLNRGHRHEDLLARIASTLFIGTLVEAVAIMPIDIMFRRKQDCYSFSGTYWAYILLLASGLVTLGPAILLPILTRRRRRWYASRCDCCGYDMTGIINARRAIDRCPECGAGWKRDVQHAPEPVYEPDTHTS